MEGRERLPGFSFRLLLALLGAIAFPAVGLGTLLGQRYLGVPSFPAYALAQVTSLVFAVVLIRAAVGPDWAKALDVRLPRVVDLALALIGWPAVSILIMGFQRLAVSWLPALDLAWLDEALAVNPAGWPWWFVGVAFAFGPAIGEELWYRGLLGWALVRPPKVVIGVLLCSLLFGLGHLRPLQILASAAFGLYLHVVYLTGRSLLIPMAVHVAQNGLGVLENLSLVSLQPLYKAVEEHPAEIYLGAALVLAVVLGTLIRRHSPKHPMACPQQTQ
jgi:membrane protease YdiL (CAAX protease family)